MTNMLETSCNELTLFLWRYRSEVRLEVEYIDLVEVALQQLSVSAKASTNVEDSITSEALHLIIYKFLSPLLVFVPELTIIAHWLHVLWLFLPVDGLVIILEFRLLIWSNNIQSLFNRLLYGGLYFYGRFTTTMNCLLAIEFALGRRRQSSGLLSCTPILTLRISFNLFELVTNLD